MKDTPQSGVQVPSPRTSILQQSFNFKKLIFIVAGGLFLVIIFLFFIPNPVTSSNSVKGTINYDASIPIPETAQLIVQLRDTSKQDVASLLIVEQIITDNLNQPPISFSLEYDLEDILDDHIHSLSVRIIDVKDQ